MTPPPDSGLYGLARLSRLSRIQVEEDMVMATTVQQASEPRGTYHVLGTRPPRHDALEKVTGAARYGADVHLPGMLHGKILRSPHAHARIHAIDTSKEPQRFPVCGPSPRRRTSPSWRTASLILPSCRGMRA